MPNHQSDQDRAIDERINEVLTDLLIFSRKYDYDLTLAQDEAKQQLKQLLADEIRAARIDELKKSAGTYPDYYNERMETLKKEDKQ